MAVLVPFLPMIMAGTAVAGGVDAFINSRQQAKQVEAGARNEQQQYEINAGQQRAAAQRQAESVREQSEVATSRARAVAGSSGGGVTDVGVTNILGDLEGGGEYRALAALYSGEENARSMESAGKTARYNASVQAGDIRAKGTSSLLSGLVSAAAPLYDKYGGATKAVATR